jgi:DNA-binding winged helix-turn-helix (wHTH) protein
MIDRPARQLSFGAFVLDLARCALLHEGRPVPLRRQSFDTLRYLAESSGQVVSRRELVAAVWPSPPADPDASVFQCIKEIRKALGKDCRWMIRTVPGAGYEFKAAVDESDAIKDASAPCGEEDPNVESSSIISPVMDVPTRIRRLVRRPVSIGLLALTAFVVLPISVALIWSAVASLYPRDARMESFLYRPAGTLPGGAVATIRTRDGKTMTSSGARARSYRGSAGGRARETPNSESRISRGMPDSALLLISW